MNLEEILKPYGKTPSEIQRIYRGRDHECRCGCKGNYAERNTPTFTRYMNEMKKVEVDGKVETDTLSNLSFVNIPFSKARDLCFCVYF